MGQYPAVDAAQRVGDYKHAAVTADHSGWVVCDGRSVLRADPAWARLFAAIGTDFGAVDGTHFNLPDGRGRAVVAPDGGAGRNVGTPNRGQAGGAETVALSVAQLPAHNHTFTDSGNNPNQQVAYQAGGNGGNFGSMVAQGYNNGFVGISNTGGGGAHQNMPPHVVAGNLFIYAG